MYSHWSMPGPLVQMVTYSPVSSSWPMDQSSGPFLVWETLLFHILFPRCFLYTYMLVQPWHYLELNGTLDTLNVQVLLIHALTKHTNLVDKMHTKVARDHFAIIDYSRNSSAEQHFVLCPKGSKDEACEEVGWKELYYCAIVVWLLWMAFYLIIVSIQYTQTLSSTYLNNSCSFSPQYIHNKFL